jgi:hypothetical protein
MPGIYRRCATTTDHVKEEHRLQNSVATGRQDNKRICMGIRQKK